MNKPKKAVLAAGAKANVKVLHPDDHSHVTQQSPLENDKRARAEEAAFEKKRTSRGTK
jgi:hypothetical protein